MAFNLTKYVEADTHEASIDVPGTDEKLTVTYRPRNLSTAALARSERDMQAGLSLAARDGLVDTLVDLIAGWDVEADGEPVPVTRDSIAAMPDQLLGVILAAVVNDAPKA